ncbi:MAG: glycosyltransferase family 2 protein [Oscillospiraceae bacterium]|nr:glycosyltransferase family 2 protein [Oscillospiraceae bacterium]
MLSVIIPAYNEGENINTASDTISGLLDSAKINFEIIFSDDGSRDNTWEIIKARAKSDPRIKGVRFSRNFGKEAAIFAGLEKAAECGCSCAVVIDCDLQHPPELIVQMHELWKDGYEVVEARKSSRGRESLVYKAFAKSFYRLMKSSSGLNLDGASDYKLLDRKVIDALNAMQERQTFFRALSAWVGFKTTHVSFEVQPRLHGKTKWSFRNLFKFALSSVTGFTNFPMHMMTVFGVLFMVMTVVLGVHTFVMWFLNKSMTGFTTVILLLLIIGSMLMFGLGIIGYYLAKIYEEIKFRPRYIVNEDTDRTKELSSND